MKYKLITDLPDVKKGMIFEPAADGRLYISKKDHKMYIYTDTEIKNTKFFKPIKDIEDKITDERLNDPIKTIGKSQ